jgi:hypothetical protein
MRRIDLESAGWEPPPGVETRTVNARGEVVADNCAYGGEKRSEYFLSGTAPLGTCYPDYYAYGDSLGYGSYYGDTLRVDTATDDDGWFERMRERLRSWRARDDSARIDSISRMPPTRVDTIGRTPPIRIDSTRPDTLRRDTVRRDTAPPIRPVRVRTDTVRRDTIVRPPPDTTGVRPPPDTTAAPPDTTAAGARAGTT